MKSFLRRKVRKLYRQADAMYTTGRCRIAYVPARGGLSVARMSGRIKKRAAIDIRRDSRLQ